MTMRVAVVGAGIVGVTTAFELAALGMEVTVFERRGSVAEETSFANAGVVAPGHIAPWAAPGMPWKVLRHLFSRHAPVLRALAGRCLRLHGVRFHSTQELMTVESGHLMAESPQVIVLNCIMLINTCHLT